MVWSFGRVGLQYRHVFAIFLSQSLLGLDMLGSDISNGKPAREIVSTFLVTLTLHAAVTPLLISLIVSMTRRTMSVSGAMATKAITIGISILIVVLGLGAGV